MKQLALIFATLILGHSATKAQVAPGFSNFESPHVHPIDLSPNGRWLAVCNTADGLIEVFDTTEEAPTRAFTVAVGLDPVSVRFRNDEELWSVNHLSDNVSIVDMNLGVVSRLLATGDEPCDVAFAGNPELAYVSCSRENQLRVFDPTDLSLEPKVLDLEGEEPRALAVSPDGQQVHVAFFESGNGTTIIAGGINDSSMITFPPDAVGSEFSPYAGQNPPPSDYKGKAFLTTKLNMESAPASGLIVKRSKDGHWLDDNGKDWTHLVSGDQAPLSGRVPGWDLIDHDVATIDTTDHSVSYEGSMMNICMALAVHPTTGKVATVGTDALNHIRYEPKLNGIFLRVNLGLSSPNKTSISNVVDLNPHLDYSTPTVPEKVRKLSLGDPRSIIWSEDGDRAYVAGMGSNNVIAIHADGRRVEAAPIALGAGPTGMAADHRRQRLYVLNRFEASVSVIGMREHRELHRVSFPDTTPVEINEGRHQFYNTHHSSGLGHVSCASCHLDGRMDRLAWDLGNPEAKKLTVNKGIEVMGSNSNVALDQHPMKGPMVTQTMQDIIGKGPFHWRGDRMTIEDFNPTFHDLLGREEELLPSEMASFKTFLDSLHFPPNPFRNDDNSLPTDMPLPGHTTTGRFSEEGQPLPNGDAQRGLDTLFKERTHPKLMNLSCFDCHTQTSGIGNGNPLINAEAEAGTLGHTLSALTGSTQRPFKVVQLRNLIDKVGFSSKADRSLNGFGFMHDGSVDSLERFVSQGMFDVRSDQEVADLVALLLSFSGNESSTSERASWSSQTTSKDVHTATGKQELLNVTDRLVPLKMNELKTVHMIPAVFREDNVGMVVHGLMGGQPRSWHLVSFERVKTDDSNPRITIKKLSPDVVNFSNIDFQADEAGLIFPFEDLLRYGKNLTFTIVATKDVARLSIDRDVDGLLNEDERRDLDLDTDGHQNPFDPDNSDVTGDHFAIGPDGILDGDNDFDGDDLTNAHEIAEGSNPLQGWKTSKDPETNLKVTLTDRSDLEAYILSWPVANPEATYQIESTQDLSTWQALTKDSIQANARDKRLHWHLDRSEETRFYRVRRQE